MGRTRQKTTKGKKRRSLRRARKMREIPSPRTRPTRRRCRLMSSVRRVRRRRFKQIEALKYVQCGSLLRSSMRPSNKIGPFTQADLLSTHLHKYQQVQPPWQKQDIVNLSTLKHEP